MLKKMSMHWGVVLFFILIVGLLFGLTYFEYSRQPAVLEGPVAVDKADDFRMGGPVSTTDGADDEANNAASLNDTATKVPIIMYHYVREVDKVRDPLGWNLSINPADFEKQLKWLKDNGYVGVHLADLIDGMVSEKAVVLTFDDGLEDFYTTALPLLQKYGFTASNAIITGMIGAHEHMNEEQIKALALAGIEITSHTVSHADLSKASEVEVLRQIKESRDFLEKQFGIKVVGFVYPSGKYNDTTVRILKDEGYLVAVTVKYGEADLVADDFLLLPRVRIDNRDGYDGFVKKMEALSAMAQ